MKISVRGAVLLMALGGLVALCGCGGAPARRAAGDADPAERVTATITAPADGATDVSTATEITLTTGNAESTSVTLTDAAGAAVDGALRADGSAWVPASQLKYATTYTAAVTATGAGRPETGTVRFTTMNRPTNLVRVSTSLQDDQVYGVGLPIVVRFDAEVRKDLRASVERRLFVTSAPEQPGSWNWFSGDEVHYRPKDYWQESTKLSVRLATGGLPLGRDAYGARDVTIRAAIGEKLVMTVDNATKTMTVSRRDQVIRTIPVSLGKPSTPSSSGAMVVMAKAPTELFVSTTPGDSYRRTVYWTQRLTTGGEYLHAAPWSAAYQGRRNVSHGCTNMSTDNARWLYGITRVGDPVIVRGTERRLRWGNGWTDWDRPWDEYVPGSALPPR